EPGPGGRGAGDAVLGGERGQGARPAGDDLVGLGPARGRGVLAGSDAATPLRLIQSRPLALRRSRADPGAHLAPSAEPGPRGGDRPMTQPTDPLDLPIFGGSPSTAGEGDTGTEQAADRVVYPLATPVARHTPT